MAHGELSPMMFLRVVLKKTMASRRQMAVSVLLIILTVNVVFVYMNGASFHSDRRSHKSKSRDITSEQKYMEAGTSLSAKQLSNVINNWMDHGVDYELDGNDKQQVDESVSRVAAAPAAAEQNLDQQQQQQQQQLSNTGIGEISLRRIEVKSSETEVEIRLDDEAIYYVNSSMLRHRGLHVLVLNQNNGDVMSRRRFDTVLSEVYGDVITFIDAVNRGRILVFATADDFSYNLHADLRYKLAEIGSQFAPSIQFRDQWAMVTIKGSGEALGETHSPSPQSDEHGGPLFMRVDLPLGALPATAACQWAPSDENTRRSQFCSRHEGYAGLCRCLQPHSIAPAQSPTSLQLDIGSVYTVVMATHRPHYLYKTLQSLAAAPGVTPAQVVVYLEQESDDELRHLATLYGFQVRHVATQMTERITSAVGNRVFNVMGDVFDTFSNAEYIIFLEEDLQCSPDFYIYFAEMRRLMQQDRTVFAASAFNIHASANTSHATDTAYRIDSFSSIAFLLARSVFRQEIQPLWPKYSDKADWDIFLARLVKKQRNCVVPDTNRVYHTGRDSLLVNTHTFDLFYQNLSFNPDPNVQLLNIKSLHKLNYDRQLEVTLKAAAIVDDFTQMCAVENMTSEFKPSNRTEIIFFQMSHANDLSTWKSLARCWGLWSESTDGNYKGLWRFWIENKKGFLFHIVMIGVPFSPYSRFKPKSLQPYGTPTVQAISTDHQPIDNNSRQTGQSRVEEQKTTEHQKESLMNRSKLSQQPKQNSIIGNKVSREPKQLAEPPDRTQARRSNENKRMTPKQKSHRTNQLSSPISPTVKQQQQRPSFLASKTRREKLANGSQ